MVFDVRPLLRAPGSRERFQFTMDLSQLDFNGRYPVSRPVEVSGEVRNSADILTLEMTARTVLDARCDRCGKAFEQEKVTRYACVLAEERESEDSDIVLVTGGMVDLEELAREAFILDMDTRTLCSEDCKGLCPRCGANLNDGPCGCKREVDPRLAALAALLDKE